MVACWLGMCRVLRKGSVLGAFIAMPVLVFQSRRGRNIEWRNVN